MGDAAARFGGEIDVLMRFKIKISPLPGQNNNKTRSAPVTAEPSKMPFCFEVARLFFV